MAARKGKKVHEWKIHHGGQEFKVDVRMDGVKLRASCEELDFEVTEESLEKLRKEAEAQIKANAFVSWVDKLLVTVQGDFKIAPRGFYQPGGDSLNWPKFLEGESEFCLKVKVIELGSSPGGWRGWREKNKTHIMRGWPECGENPSGYHHGGGDRVLALVDPTPEAQETLQSISTLMNRTFLKLQQFLHPDRIEENLSAGMPALLAAPEPAVDPPAIDDEVDEW